MGSAATEQAPSFEPAQVHGLRRLFSDRPGQHAWRAPAGHGFEDALAEIGSLRPAPGQAAVVVVPTRYTFFRVGEVCAFAAAARGHVCAPPPPPPPPPSPLPLRPLTSIWERLSIQLTDLERLFRDAGVAVRPEDPDLRPLLERVQQAARSGGIAEVELLHALSALCEHDLVGPPKDRLVDPLHRFGERVMQTLRRAALLDAVVPGPRAEFQPALLPGLSSPLAERAAALQEPPSPRIEAPAPPPGLEAVPVGRRDWWRLEERVADLCAKRGVAPPELPGGPVALRPLPGLASRVAARVAILNASLASIGAGFVLDLGPEDVLGMLFAFESGLRGFDPQRERTLLRLLGIASEHAFIGPQTLHVDVIAACQHRCTFCYTYTPLIGRRRLKEMGRGTGQKLDFDLYLALLDDLQRMDSVDDLLFNGPGEPMLHPRIMDMLAEAKRRGFTTTLFTNGLMLDEAHRERLMDLEVDRVYWSMHACTERSYSAVHPGRPAGEFDLQVAQGTELMRRRRERGAVHPQVYLVNVLGAETWDEAVVTAELAARIGVDHVRLQLTLSHDDETDVMAASDAQVAAIRAALPEARQICERHGIHLLENLDIQVKGRPGEGALRDADFEDCDWSYRRYVDSGCHVGWLFSRIWVDGSISFCCHPKIVDDLSRERGYAAAYFGERYDHVRRVAARWDTASNVDLHKRYPSGLVKGAMLFDKACDHCGNYEHMELVQREVGALSALQFLPRTVPLPAPGPGMAKGPGRREPALVSLPRRRRGPRPVTEDRAGN